MREQYKKLDDFFKQKKVNRILLVCGNSINQLEIGEYFSSLENRLGIKVIRFSAFEPNPTYESVVEGVKVFVQEKIELIVAVGGGSAMDVAKCIKLYSNMDHSRNYFEQEIVPNNIDFIAIPTTAGSGSEATRFAVITYKGEKVSVMDDSLLPSLVLLDATTLRSLPLYQKKSTMLDTLCHAIESYWSIHSTDESKSFAKQAIQLVVANKDDYLNNTDDGNEKMLLASNLAGKAINITKTTAGHAMSYKITGLYNTAHGHAVALCVLHLFPYMSAHMGDCVDSRGKEYLEKTIQEIEEMLGGRFADFYNALEMDKPKANRKEFEILKSSVNKDKLKNHPVALDENAIDYLYHQILDEV